MALRVCVLGSSSSGNCTYVGSAGTGLLIDAGLSGKETFRRLEQVGIDTGTLKGIFVTHEHSDHVSGLRVVSRRLNIEIYANAGTAEAVETGTGKLGLRWRIFTTGSSFDVGDLAVEPFSVCHDGRDPVGFVITARDGGRVAGVTDMGVVTSLVRERMKNANALIVEANHDSDMLRDAPRPWSLKQRITGRQGHLSNSAAAELVAEVAGPALSHIFLAHISSDCNTRELAVRAVREALDARGISGVGVSPTFSDRAGKLWVSE